MLTEADAKKQEAINQGKEIENKPQMKQGQISKKISEIDDGDDGSDEFFLKIKVLIFSKEIQVNNLFQKMKNQIKSAFEYKQNQLENKLK